MRDVLHLGEIVAAHARLRPQKIGARDSRRAFTFAQWNERACRLANALLGLGLTVNLFSRTACHGSRVFRHPQVVEDEARAETEFAH